MNPKTYRRRIEKLSAWMSAENLDALVIHDTEGRRSAHLRYLSGMPEDAILFIFRSGKSVLVPWDIHLAHQLAAADETIPQEEFKRDSTAAITAVLSDALPSPGSRVEFSSATPYHLFKTLESKLSTKNLISRSDGMDDALLRQRMIKDEDEIAIYRRASRATDAVIDCIEENWSSFKTETDIALAIEKTGRDLGAEGTGFQTIAAGPSRSFGIHAFPSYTGAGLSDPGLTIIDFGLVFEGYTTDVTITAASGRLDPRQEEILSLVQEAYTIATETAAPGKSTSEIAKEVTRFFSSRGRQMPHSLGHGIGLEAHEYPFLRDRTEGQIDLESGMIITIEPGLYAPETGGARLENDFLITEDGIEQLTSSRIIRVT